jgi:hypothetical protein
MARYRPREYKPLFGGQQRIRPMRALSLRYPSLRQAEFGGRANCAGVENRASDVQAAIAIRGRYLKTFPD